MGDLEELGKLDAMAQAELASNQVVKPIELIEAAIERIEKVNPFLNAVVTPMYDIARDLAKSELPDGPFTGVPFLLKDLDATYAGVRHTEGSLFMKDYVASQDSELVKRYKKAGLIVAGKTNTPEFGLTLTTEPVLFGPCKNPWNTDYSTGGSSGGSAAAVAAGMVPFAHANDGGGSIRIPASFCGVFGLKPTRGRNPYGPSFDQPGMTEGVMQEHCVSRTVRDSAALLDATAGRTPGGLHHVSSPGRAFLEEVGANPGTLRIGFSVRSPLEGEVHQDCVDGVHEIARLCENLGHEVIEADLQIDARILEGATGSEITRFIDRVAEETGRTPTADQFEPMTWEWYQAGKNKSATDFIKHMANARRFQFQIEQFMSDYDAWLTPTITRPPVPLGWLDASKDYDEYLVRMYDLVPFVFLCNLSGLPGMSVPLVWNDEGLPIGMHFVGRFGDEATLFRLAGQLEEARPWVSRLPGVSALV